MAERALLGVLVVALVCALAWWWTRWRPPHRAPCCHVEAFVDGTLEYPEAEGFISHLPDCRRCQRGVIVLMQIEELGREYVRGRAAKGGDPSDG